MLKAWKNAIPVICWYHRHTRSNFCQPPVPCGMASCHGSFLPEVPQDTQWETGESQGDAAVSSSRRDQFWSHQYWFAGFAAMWHNPVLVTYTYSILHTHTHVCIHTCTHARTHTHTLSHAGTCSVVKHKVNRTQVYKRLFVDVSRLAAVFQIP